MTQSPQRWGKVGNAQRFPSGPRPRLFHNQTIPLALDKNRQSLHCATPDFLLNSVGSASFMRLSSRKAAHAALSTAAQQEIRVRFGRDDKVRVVALR
jgi:phosphatidylserine/phosphatidylglycerophosphate/cardiolipin synthase-like enzyme